MPNTYEKLIPRREREKFEQVLGMESGYLLDFSDRTFADFFYETLDIDPENQTGLFNGRGTSKAKRFRSFLERAPAGTVAYLLRKLWDYREQQRWDRERYNNFTISEDELKQESPEERSLRENYFAVVARFEGSNQDIDSTAFEAFEPSETLEELIAAIRRDLDAKRPQAGLDRLHTYCMKRFAALVRKHGSDECGDNDPLHSRVGKYVKALRAQRTLTTLSERIIKTSIDVFEAMNEIRNNRSLAHDNPDLVDPDEARFIFDSVAAILRFIKAIDSQKFED